MRLKSADEMWLQAKRRKLASKQNWLCFFCKCLMNEIPNDPWQASLDHYPKAVHNGGTARPENLVVSCRTCNGSRHPELEMRKRQASCIVATTGETHTSPFEILREQSCS